MNVDLPRRTPDLHAIADIRLMTPVQDELELVSVAAILEAGSVRAGDTAVMADGNLVPFAEAGTTVMQGEP